MFKVELNSLAETEIFGMLLGRIARPGDIYCLDGDLGSGKTTLTRFIAQGAGVDSDCVVSSPTFAIMHEYPGKLQLYHIDCYRLGGGDELLDLGFEEYWEGEGLTVVEWASMAQDVLPEEKIMFHLSVISEEKRVVKISPSPGMIKKAKSLIETFLKTPSKR